MVILYFTFGNIVSVLQQYFVNIALNIAVMFETNNTAIFKYAIEVIFNWMLYEYSIWISTQYNGNMGFATWDQQ